LTQVGRLRGVSEWQLRTWRGRGSEATKVRTSGWADCCSSHSIA